MTRQFRQTNPTGPLTGTLSAGLALLLRSRLVGRASGDRAGGRGRVVADPLVLPRVVVLLLVAAGSVACDEFAGDLLPMRPAAARHLVPCDVHLPPVPGATRPARCARVPEREALGGQVVAVTDVDHCVPVRLGLGLVR